MISAEELVRCVNLNARPHVVILGAGASIAAFPNGDRGGRRLPAMDDLVEIVGLSDTLRSVSQDPKANFEKLYSTLHKRGSSNPMLREIETKVEHYFEKLALPDGFTLYDLLLLSLRPKDAIFTFNWDPFLADTYQRHAGATPLPHIFHLHGNVRVAFCRRCAITMLRRSHCPACGGELLGPKLLFPVEKKNYAKDPFIKTQWEAADNLVRRAFIITIFGYSAPRTDREAIGLIKKAWKGSERDHLVKRVEVIDIENPDILAKRWSNFAYHDHYDTWRGVHESLLGCYPRRSCEALYNIGVKGNYTEPIPRATNLEELEARVEKLQKYEIGCQ